ncbi:MAG: hypothetical protein ACMXYL_02495 [Candidatus Woesearchaeota archaeon]
MLEELLSSNNRIIDYDYPDDYYIIQDSILGEGKADEAYEYNTIINDENTEDEPLKAIKDMFMSNGNIQSYELPYYNNDNNNNYSSLTEKLKRSFNPSYTNYSRDVMNKEIEYVNIPEIMAYGWTFPNDPNAPITINTAYANTQEQINSTIYHEMVHEQSRTHHENHYQHEHRVRVMTGTNY